MNDPLDRSQRLKTLHDSHNKTPSLFERLSQLLLREPEDREQLLSILHSAHERELVDADALSMMEGVLQVGELSARDVMVPRPQMDMIDANAPLDNIIPYVIQTAHSRFPVFDGNRDNVIGILLAKDLLRYYHEEDFNLRDILRPVVFIPGSKPLNVLLRDFRGNRNHMALVVDEYGGAAGLVTIEDVLEQIVGDIEDEHDWDEDEDMIVAADNGTWRVKALTDIEQFNEQFGTEYETEEFDTIGGLVTNELGRVPRRNERLVIGPMQFEVLRADARQVHVLLVTKMPSASPEHAVLET
jgi:magnesium and cobalt transporter